jgi:hypothetical protein
MILQDHEIILTLTEDTTYLTDIALRSKYNLLNERGFRKYILQYVKYVWIGETRGIRGGVVYFCFIPGINQWVFDAYKEDEKLKVLDNKGNFSYRVGRILLGWFFERGIAQEIFTMHEVENRGATILCKKLDFKIDNYHDGFVVLKREARHG